jgi:hypothetical protein
MINFIRQNRLALLAIMVLAFSGCNDDRSHPDAGNNGNSVVYGNPIAVIDVNGTGNTFQGENNGYLIYRYADENNPFIFNCSNSYDSDENNQSIVGCDWNITSNFTDGCLDINNTGNIVYVNVCNEAYNDGDINATLTVTDDESKTASSTQLIKLN